MEIKFPKLYRYDRIGEHVHVTLPFPQGELFDENDFHILDGERILPSASLVTGRYADGSVRYLLVRFMADLPANAGKSVFFKRGAKASSPFVGIRVKKLLNGFEVDGGVYFRVMDESTTLFEELVSGGINYQKEQFVGPMLKTADGKEHGICLGKWELEEESKLVTVLSNTGCMEEAPGMRFTISVVCYAEKPWIEIRYRLINATKASMELTSLVFALLSKEGADYNGMLLRNGEKGDFVTTGISGLEEIEGSIGDAVRTTVASSNYKTNFYISSGGKSVEKYVDSRMLLMEANEHFSEVFYGTFFADRSSKEGGVCATIYQAQQNYPKAVKADDSGVYVMLVPEGVDRVVMESGMSREQRFMLHFHNADETLVELDNRSLIYQMPDRPFIAPTYFEKAGVAPDIFVSPADAVGEVEIALIGRCDGHSRSLGMLAFGDAPDQNYTAQGRGNGALVWSNNEYDFPHACALQYMRCPERRFLDYMLVSARHQMDVDVCHYSENPLHLGGQWEHCARHVGMDIVCSHQWVEGLLDYYHFTGEKRAFDTAIGMGDNILRLLETDTYKKVGESNARETGWALRSLTALYVETGDEKWVAKAEEIISQFLVWEQSYGGWLATYTDNTVIRVGFMIAVAAGSLMRYYRVFPRDDIKELLLRAVDDLIENGMLGNGVFYYKELPSLNRVNTNTLLLEALTIGYELSGDKKYLEYGLTTFRMSLRSEAPSPVGSKKAQEDAVIYYSASPKGFAQSFLPLAMYYKAIVKEGLWDN